MDNALSIYIHWPFCASKCPYCDFNSFVSGGVDQARWKAALLCEIESYASGINGRMTRSIYFGGGSPSLMRPDVVAELIFFIRNSWGLAEDAEITLEANPTSVEARRLQDFRDAGVTRLSLGAQSLEERALRFLGRGHTANDVRVGIALAAECFSRYSFDMIYGRPGQTPAHWRRELGEALTLVGGHISLYQLTIEPGTIFHRDGVAEADEETAAALFEVSQELMGSNGLFSYEISNYARPGEECRHNLACWRGGDYLGIGPGAHGRLTSPLGTEAMEQIRSPEKWLLGVEKNGRGSAQRSILSSQERCEELLLMGLRLNEGVDAERFFALTGKKIERIVNSYALEKLVHGGFLEINNTCLLATKAGRLRLNAVLAELLA